uniref:Retrotransposon protein, putative, Ty1-copia subclass n=1 Tax=Tanacetum cinerariifolium TaxID=118510 RepID=A0A6L2N9L1_TANCI|nr:retrotransposon protein, putative, Ty1-copia subclass [Tanacetum cinerariifolium]
MVMDSVQLETAVNTISHEYLLEFTSEYGIPEMLHPELPGPGDRIVDFPEGKVGWMSFSKKSGKNTPQCYTKPLDSLKNWNNRFFWIDERVFPTVVDWRTNASKDEMPVNGTYSVEAVRALDTHRTPIQKQPEMLVCLVEISRRYYLRDEVYPTFHYDDDRGGLIRAPNPTKVETGSRPRVLHEVSLLTLTASRVIEMDEPAEATDSSGVPSAIEKSPLDFAHEDWASDQGTAAPEMPSPEDVPATAAPGSLQRDHTDLRPSGSSHGEKSLASMQLCLVFNVFVSKGAPANVSDPNPLSFADAPSHHPVDVSQSSFCVVAAKDLESENASSPTEVGSPGSVYRPEWGVTNELRHMRNEDFLGQYNVNLARQVALGSQQHLRFEQEAKLLRKSVAQVARRDKRIEARELEIKNLEALLETEADIKRVAEDKSAGLIKELEDMRARFSDLQVSHGQLSQQVGRWVVGHGLRLAMMKCAESLEMRQAFADVVSARVAKGMSEGLKHGLEHGQAQLTVESIEAYDPEAEDKFVAALQSLKDLKYHLLDQLEGLKDAPMDVIMAALYLESDTGGCSTIYTRPPSQLLSAHHPRVPEVLRVEKKMFVIEQPIPPAPTTDSEANVLAEWNAIYDAYNDTIGKLHAMLIEYEKCLPKKAETPQVMMIKSGKIQKANKKSLKAKGKGRANGKGKDKQGYIPKTKNPKPYAKEHLAKDDTCHNCKEVGIFTTELFAFPNKSWVYDTGYGNGVREQVEAIRSFDLVLPNGLVIYLDNCYYAPSITRGVVSVHRLVKNGFVQCFADFGISVSKNNVHYFIAIPNDYSRYGYVYLLKHKYEVFEMFKVFKNEVENKLEKTIKALRSDLGGYPKETIGYYFYFLPENKIVVARYAELFKKNLITQEVSGRAIDFEEIQDEDTPPSEITSKIPMEVNGFELPQEEVISIRRAIRILISIVAFYDYEIGQMDFKTSFLNGYLDEDIYMVYPKGFVDPDHPRKVCKLQ